MIKLNFLKSKPLVFRRMTGIPVEKFEELFIKFSKKWNANRKKRLLHNKKRVRAFGAGRNYDLKPEEMLLMVLIYCRVYMSQIFLGFLFDKNQSNISRPLRECHKILSEIFQIPEKKIKMDEDEILELVFDATEQEIYRPQIGQKEYYSGKKKKHTIKHQITVTRNGRIKAVSKSFSGKTHDKSVYEKSKIKINKEVVKLGDLAYIGTDVNTPHKKPKGRDLTKKQVRQNKKFAQKRIIVEHVLGKMKIFKIIAHEYRNQLCQHDIIFRNIAGLYNFVFIN